MEIKPTYVTFKQAKLLKENGFNIKTNTAFYPNGEVSNYYPYDNLGENNSYFWRPEQWEVIEWLRVEKDIYVASHFDTLFLKGKYNILIHKISLQTIYPIPNKKQSGYNSPQESYSAAFDYILNNLL